MKHHLAHELGLRGTVASVISAGLLALVACETTSPVPIIDVRLDSEKLTIRQGECDSVSISVTYGGGYRGNVALAVPNAPAGITSTLTPRVISSGGSSATLTVNVAPTMAPGTYSITIVGSGIGRYVHTERVVLSLVIEGPPSPISVSFHPKGDSAWVFAGETETWQGVTVARSAGFTDVVTLSIEGLPPGITATFEPPSLDASMTTSAVSFTTEPTLWFDECTLATIRAKSTGINDATTVFWLCGDLTW